MTNRSVNSENRLINNGNCSSVDSEENLENKESMKTLRKCKETENFEDDFGSAKKSFLMQENR